MTTNDLLFVIGIFVFIFLLWILSGGPSHKPAYIGPILNSNEILLPKVPNINKGRIPTQPSTKSNLNH